MRTGIFKQAVPGRVKVHRLGLEGDGQGDLRVHGGPDKAVYAYPSEHYAAWRKELGREDLSWGFFGENLSTAGLLEAAVRIGDRLKAGGALLEVTKPRFPCFKLGNRAGSMEFVRAFQESLRSGFYLRVLAEGEVGQGDKITKVHTAAEGPTIAEVVGAANAESDRD